MAAQPQTRRFPLRLGPIRLLPDEQPLDPKAEALGEIYLGDRDFARRRSPRTAAATEVPRRQREPIRCSLEELLTGRSDAALAFAYREGYSLRELARVLGVHYSTISRRLKREERALASPEGVALQDLTPTPGHAHDPDPRPDPDPGSERRKT